jgi:hypothetical protein
VIAPSVRRLATGWTTERSEFEPRYGLEFLLSTTSGPALGPNQPPLQWVSRALLPAIMRPGREANHSPQTSVDIKETWI